MLVSLNGGERAPAADPVAKSTVRSARTSGLSPQTLTLLDQLRERFERPRRPEGTDTPEAVPALTAVG